VCLNDGNQGQRVLVLGKSYLERIEIQKRNNYYEGLQSYLLIK